MPKTLPWLAAVTLGVSLTSHLALAADNSAPKAQETAATHAFITVPNTFNSPASSAVDSAGNLYFTSPNFNNDGLVKSGVLAQPAPPAIGKVAADNTFTSWYTFTPQDMAPSTGKLAPMGIALGPDGNAYVADMQYWFDKNHQSRILRIVIENGKAVRSEVVATGLLFPNGLAWKGDDLFISETILSAEEGDTLSGVYKVNLAELDAAAPLALAPFTPGDSHDAHLLETFHSNGSLSFGANGVAFDDNGDLYTSLMEDGSIVKTRLDADNKVISSAVWADGMVATDGMKWDSRSQRIYIADLFDNAIYSIDPQGNKTLMARNGATDGANGELDAPAEVAIRGNEVITTNFDATFDDPRMVNRTAGAPFTLSILPIE
ncbi:hypothetical protein HA399_09290 [Cobetia sp. UIB-001]|uniref:hypothetical protein n=1 Tax=Cobetia sp. UIB-001 TaxID=2717697 RepID=UPI00384D5CAA